MRQGSSPLQRNVLQRTISPLFYVVIAVFLAYYLKSIDFSKLKDVHILPWALAVSLGFGLLTRYWGAYIWFVILRSLGANNLARSRIQLTYVYAKSWLGRYVPGTAPWIFGKIYFASKLGISKSKLAISSVLEAGLQIVVILALSLAVLLLDPRFDVVSPGLRLLMALLLLACIVAMIPAVFNYVLAFFYKFLKKKVLPGEDKVAGSLALRGMVLYAAGAIINGLSLFFIAKGVYPALPYETMLFIISVGNLAGVLGMMAIFVPSGIGVREGVQLALLSTIMPTETALIITVATRLIGVVADVAFYLIAFLHTKLVDTSAL